MNKNNTKIILSILLLICSIFILGFCFYKDIVITSYKSRGYRCHTTPHFDILYLPQNKKDLKYIADAAEKTYEIVGRDFNFYPEKKIPIIVYKDSKSLQKAFHWPQDESNQGVYYNGIIYIQAPSAWIESGIEMETFFAKGPMVHEYTHLVVDSKTLGNYPRWFTEGVAQWEEERVTGYTLREDFDIDKNYMYSPYEIFYNFDKLDDVPKAYIQALEMTKALTDENSIEEIEELFSILRDGKSLENIYLKRHAFQY